MYRKDCHNCKKSSYSANKFDEWICPSCGKDLTKEKEKSVYKKNDKETEK